MNTSSSSYSTLDAAPGANLRALLRAHLEDHTCSWSIGGYGAIAEFHWLPDDPSDPPSGHGESLRVATGAGALALTLRDDILV